jgi:hypothetical protein
MSKMGDVIHDADDDDEMRTSTSQNCVKATLCTEEFFFRTRYIKLSPNINREVLGG